MVVPCEPAVAVEVAAGQDGPAEVTKLERVFRLRPLESPSWAVVGQPVSCVFYEAAVALPMAVGSVFLSAASRAWAGQAMVQSAAGESPPPVARVLQ